MRLLNVHTLLPHDFGRVSRPSYIIASHRWIPGQELTFEECMKQQVWHQPGYQKVQSLCNFIKCLPAHVRTDWLWIDTCCIDKRDGTEKQREIASMFDWYQQAVFCIAYLSDVYSLQDFEKSVWFRRGWTLQELLAPPAVLFLSSTGSMLGFKLPSSIPPAVNQLLSWIGPSVIVLNNRISQRTGIPEGVLWDFETSKLLSVNQRKQWMNGRETLEPEDQVYCQLGIFDIEMQACYGESFKRKVMAKFDRKLVKEFGDLDLPPVPPGYEASDESVKVVERQSQRKRRVRPARNRSLDRAHRADLPRNAAATYLYVNQGDDKARRHSSALDMRPVISKFFGRMISSPEKANSERRVKRKWFGGDNDDLNGYDSYYSDSSASSEGAGRGRRGQAR